MALIPEKLNQHINEAHPQNVCVVAIINPDGYASMSPRGSILVYDQDTLAYWDRGKGQSADSVKDGAKISVYYRNMALGARGGDGTLPAGGIARFFGVAEVHADEDDEVREKVWNDMVEAERNGDPDKKGRAILLKLERAEQLTRKPLSDLED